MRRNRQRRYHHNVRARPCSRALQQLAGSMRRLAPAPRNSSSIVNDVPLAFSSSLARAGAASAPITPWTRTTLGVHSCAASSFVDLIPERFRSRDGGQAHHAWSYDDGGGSFEVIEDMDEVIKLAGRGGCLTWPKSMACRRSSSRRSTSRRNSIAAGLMLREAAIPLVRNATGSRARHHLPDC